MQVLRTPDDRFANLPDFPFAPHYQTVRDASGVDLRIGYIDEGPRDAAPVLLMHGEPSWSYLYRGIIAPLMGRHRVVAPDLVGFGRSDKPAETTDYSYEQHVAWMSDWLVALDLKDITLFCQDWGGLIGLRLVAAFPERFARVIVANTGMPTGSGMSDGFKAWLAMSQSIPVFPAGMIVNMGSLRDLSPEEIAAYDAPYPDETYKSGARIFPTFVPVTPEHPSVAENKAAWQVLEAFDKPFLTAFSDGDPVSKGGDAPFQQRVPGAKGQKHTIIEGGGHFLQEDRPAEIAALIDGFIAGTRG
ncbi:MAG: haloalkane dehalogenase [Caulobacter sp.]|nr:haloalkane dehalogenase [Caulobacter sp.]